jgi:hypothetical protein
MKLTEVSNPQHISEFHDVARTIYKDDPYWVCPLELEIEGIFNSSKNEFFKNGEATRWILKNEQGKLIGRVAAFINKNKAFTYEVPTGGMGFFECIEDKDAAYLLFDQCRFWLQERGMKAMDGPINFGENDNYWGLLVDGFTQPGVGMPYNPKYYQEFFESYGFKFYYEQVTNHLDLRKPFPERFWKIADWVRQKPGYSFEHFSFSNASKYLNNLKEIYDDAWQFHENFTPLNIETLNRTLEGSKAVIEEEFVWFAYYEKEPAAFLVMFPDLNQILKHLNGKLNFWNKLKIFWLKKHHTITRARITIMGVKPKFQKSGIESAIFWHLQKVMNKRPWYNELELSWVGDFNPKMRALHESVGSVFAKKHITYRMPFDTDYTFHRSVIIPRDTREKVVLK